MFLARNVYKILKPIPCSFRHIRYAINSKNKNDRYLRWIRMSFCILLYHRMYEKKFTYENSIVSHIFINTSRKPIFFIYSVHMTYFCDVPSRFLRRHLQTVIRWHRKFNEDITLPFNSRRTKQLNRWGGIRGNFMFICIFSGKKMGKSEKLNVSCDSTLLTSFFSGVTWCNLIRSCLLRFFSILFSCVFYVSAMQIWKYIYMKVPYYNVKNTLLRYFHWRSSIFA